MHSVRLGPRSPRSVTCSVATSMQHCRLRIAKAGKGGREGGGNGRGDEGGVVLCGPVTTPIRTVLHAGASGSAVWRSCQTRLVPHVTCTTGTCQRYYPIPMMVTGSSCKFFLPLKLTNRRATQQTTSVLVLPPVDYNCNKQPMQPLWTHTAVQFSAHEARPWHVGSVQCTLVTCSSAPACPRCPHLPVGMCWSYTLEGVVSEL